MKLGNSVGFILFGLLMVFLPLLDPGLCPRTGLDGTSSRALWLDFMGTVQAGIGFWLVGLRAYDSVSARLIAFREARAVRRASAPVFVGSHVDAR